VHLDVRTGQRAATRDATIGVSLIGPGIRSRCDSGGASQDNAGYGETSGFTEVIGPCPSSAGRGGAQTVWHWSQMTYAVTEDLTTTARCPSPHRSHTRPALSFGLSVAISPRRARTVP
jgi:hypothetical protein